MIHFDGDGPKWTHMGGPICPDLTTSRYFGSADNLRGRVVLLFFRVLDRLMPVGAVR